MNRTIRIIVLTEQGRILAQKVQRVFHKAIVDYKPKPFVEHVQRAFLNNEALIMICATGIVVRTLAPVLQNKANDPPVIVCDEHGQYIIPLLSGHEGGANAWAAQLANKINAQLVLTTASQYVAPVYTAGMGCERGCPESVLYDLLLESLQQANIGIDEIKSINSIDIKSDEEGLINLAKTIRRPFQTFDTSNLRQVESRLSTKSDYVYSIVGVYGVAESAALWAAQVATGKASELVLQKVKNSQATCAIARSYYD